MPSGYGLVLRIYYALHGRQPPDPAGYVLAQPGWLPQGATVLDFGGGDGRWASELAERAATVTVADVDDAALRRVPPHPRLRTALLDGRALPFPDGAFDLIFASHVVHHVPDPAPVVRELGRVVRVGGRIVCIEFHPDCAVTRIYRLLCQVKGHRCTFYRPEALVALLGQAPLAAEPRMLDACQYVVSARRLA